MSDERRCICLANEAAIFVQPGCPVHDPRLAPPSPPVSVEAPGLLERLISECHACSVCGHLQADPNWCHECGGRLIIDAQWAKELLAELEAVKDERDELNVELDAARASRSPSGGQPDRFAAVKALPEWDRLRRAVEFYREAARRDGPMGDAVNGVVGGGRALVAAVEQEGGE